MLLTLKIKLLTTDKQHRQLLQTMERFNEACNYISEFAWANKTFGKIKLQKGIYYDARNQFELSAQMVVRAIGKVSESYKTDRKLIHRFNPHGAIVYDPRILSFKSLETCSILTLDGRETVPIAYGEYRPLDLNRVRGQADLVLSNNHFYLMVVVDLPEDPKIEPTEIIGIDLGIVNIATTSTGQQFSGKKCTEIRKKYSTLKAQLQSVQTWNAKKHLKRIRGKERRFKRDINHSISKQIVSYAKDTLSGIALEDLTGIRERVPGYKALRESIGKWAFFELAAFIQYKACLAGLPVVVVDPNNTSRMCSCCGYTARENRKTQSTFHCLSCGYTENADMNAAKNIAFRAAVNQPIALRPDKEHPVHGRANPMGMEFVSCPRL